MKKPYAIPVFVTLSFLLGIALGFVIESRTILYVLFAGIFFFFLVAYFRAKRLFVQDDFFAITAFLIFVALGFLNTWEHQPENNPQHYIHQKWEGKANVQLTIKERLNPNPYQRNYIATVEKINNKPAEGKVLLSVRKDSLSQLLSVDDRVVLVNRLVDIHHPLNPFQFDYAHYMANQGVLKQIQTTRGEFKILQSTNHSLRGWAANIRLKLEKDLQQTDFSTAQRALIEALLLGQRSELSKDAYHNFIDAGVVHVLAVSGLHIGILLYFLLLMFKPLTYLPKGKTIRTVLVISLLWAYAFLVGMSPSILRAVTMFSFLSLGLFFNRKVLTLNMLCLSAVVLLLYNPNFILDVGFQLSYSAVLAILLFQKKIYQIFSPKYKVTRYLWQISSVTLSAQLGVLPLSLFYFHQFPGLFFLSNLVIIPFVGIIIEVGAGILVLLGIFGGLPHFLVVAYGGVLDALQFMVDWVAQQETFIFRHLYFSPTMLVISVLVLVFLGFWLYKRRRAYIFLFLGMLIGLQLDYLYEYIQIQHQQNFYVFYKSRHTIIGVQHGHDLKLLTDRSISPKTVLGLSLLEGMENARGLENITIDTVQNYYILGYKRLLVIDSCKVWHLPKRLQLTYLLLRNSPEINLDRVLDSLHPQRVIADGSSYKSMIARWQKTCAERSVAFYYTGKEGALKLTY